MLVIAEDFIGASLIQHWQCGTALSNSSEFVSKTRGPQTSPPTRQPLTQGGQDSLGEAFARRCGQLARQPVRFKCCRRT